MTSKSTPYRRAFSAILGDVPGTLDEVTNAVLPLTADLANLVFPTGSEAIVQLAPHHRAKPRPHGGRRLIWNAEHRRRGDAAVIVDPLGPLLAIELAPVPAGRIRITTRHWYTGNPQTATGEKLAHAYLWMAIEPRIAVIPGFRPRASTEQGATEPTAATHPPRRPGRPPGSGDFPGREEFTNRLRLVLRAWHLASHGYPTKEIVAVKVFGISVRTLDRWLAAAGLTWPDALTLASDGQN